jgi:hypothetical protein
MRFRAWIRAGKQVAAVEIVKAAAHVGEGQVRGDVDASRNRGSTTSGPLSVLAVEIRADSPLGFQGAGLPPVPRA